MFLGAGGSFGGYDREEDGGREKRRGYGFGDAGFPEERQGGGFGERRGGGFADTYGPDRGRPREGGFGCARMHAHFICCPPLRLMLTGWH